MAAAAADPQSTSQARLLTKEDQQFRQQCTKLQETLTDLYSSCQDTTSNGFTMSPGFLSALHDDMHVLLRSKAGGLVLEFLRQRGFPKATEILYQRVSSFRSSQLGSTQPSDSQGIVNTWKYFHRNILPQVQTMFGQIKSQSTEGVRDIALVAFRDGVVLPLSDYISQLFPTSRKEMRHMLLVLMDAKEKGKPTTGTLKLEKLLGQAVSPFQGYLGYYEDYAPQPKVPSNEYQVSHLRRLSVVDPQKLTRPLSMTSCKPIETLQDLFQLSAGRHKAKTANGRKRWCSTSDAVFIGSLGF